MTLNRLLRFGLNLRHIIAAVIGMEKLRRDVNSF